MTEFIFSKFKEFAEEHNLDVSIIREKKVEGITILKFTHIKTKRHTNIVLNAYDLLNVSEKEIIEEVLNQVKRRILK